MAPLGMESCAGLHLPQHRFSDGEGVFRKNDTC